jgi:uncharacterized protein (TIGR03437 family)
MHARAGISALLIGLLTWLGVFGVLLQPSWRSVHPRVSTSSKLPSPTVHLQVAETLSQLPLSFEANRGQTDKTVQFIARGKGYTLYLADAEARFELRDKTNQRSAFSLQLAGASFNGLLEGMEPLPARSNYFIGNNPDEWQTDVPSFARVRQQNVYPGIDVIFYGKRQQLEYDFVVAPHANPQQIKLTFNGATQIELDGKGDLLIDAGISDKVTARQMRMHKPVIYQEINGQRQLIEGSFTLDDSRAIGFELGDYDATLPLVIDPVVDYATYAGGSGTDIGYSIAVDQQGYAYITGQTSSLNFPTKNAFATTLNGANDAFVMKLSQNGSSVIFSTFIGGRNPGDKGSAIAVDKAGNIYFTGETNSLNFPTANAAFPTFRGNIDAFIAKFNIDGNVLIYSTYFGGTFFDGGYGIALDQFDNAYITGRTASINLPMKNALQSALHGQQDAFVAKFDPDGALLYSTYLGGELSPGASRDDEAGYSIAVDSLQNVYVTGFTSSSSFPTVNAFQNTFGGVEDAFLTKINAAGTALVYSTFLGGDRTEEASAIAVDAFGNAYVTGYTFSIDFPITANALQRLYGGNVDAFVTKFNATGSALLYSTFLGGNGAENTGLVSDNLPVGGIVVDNLGYAYVTGKTESANFPVVRALQSALRGDGDAFIAKIDPAGSELVYSTYLGSSFTGNNGFDERGLDLTLDKAGSIYVTGQVLKDDISTVAPMQMNFGGGLSDAFVAKISSPDIVTIAPVSAASFVGASLAPEEISAIFGANLASGTEIAQTVPLPTSLLGASVKVRDRAGTERAAGLFFVSPGQINFQIPLGTAVGKATITATNAQAVSTSATVLIEKTAPGLFAANANGQGVAAAVLVRVKPDSSQIFEPVIQLNDQNQFVPTQIDFGPDLGNASDQLFLILFGTGWRGRSALNKVTAQIAGIPIPVLYAGEQGNFLGEDQINLQLPRTLVGRGVVNISITVDGQIVNQLTVAFR